uniref:Uncharacterized protein n=1 Tax=Knufia peltigerae TaxID=1002370 RepID=A0AA38XXS0_9EURO|nr:hypothetical protein H2204_009650 [Knufia peltigerae]
MLNDSASFEADRDPHHAVIAAKGQRWLDPPTDRNTMSDTGRFHVLELNAETDAQHRVTYVNTITMRCNACGHVSRRTSEQLEQIPGGTVLACSRCGAHQAVSNARLQCRLMPTGHGEAPSAA